MADTPRYSYLGPAGTFTWEALTQVPDAEKGEWVSVNNVGEALDDVQQGRSDYAMIAIENSIEGGVSATLPQHHHVPAASNVQAALAVVDGGLADAAIAPPGITEQAAVEIIAENIGDNPDAATRFVLVQKGGKAPARTGADKTSIIAELPDDRAGGLLEMLEQFATRGVNLSLLESRPVGDSMGRYRFVIDLDGHIDDERVADALMGLRRFSPNVIYLGSYPRANGHVPSVSQHNSDEAFAEARAWISRLRDGSADTA